MKEDTASKLPPEPTFRKFQNTYYIYYPEGDYWEKTKPVKEKTALLIIDIQKHYLNIAIELRDKFSNPYLYDRLTNVVIPNAKKLLEFFRKNNLVVTFTIIGNYREDGRDRSPTQARPGWNYTLLKIGSKPQELVDELKPLENEVVVYKTTDSALNGSPLGHILRWMGVEHVVVAGIFTDQCVSSTVRDLSDWGFTVYIVEDATAAISKEIHEFELRLLNQIYGKVVSTEEIIRDLQG
jgi:nicotinamidase-related amidase